jgi:hypothetical protein
VTGVDQSAGAVDGDGTGKLTGSTPSPSESAMLSPSLTPKPEK